MRPILRILTDLVSLEPEPIGKPLIETAEFAGRDDAIECGHPRGAMRCTRLIACCACPYAVVFEVEPERAA